MAAACGGSARQLNELVDWFNAVDLTYRTDLRELNEIALRYVRFTSSLIDACPAVPYISCARRFPRLDGPRTGAIRLISV